MTAYSHTVVARLVDGPVGDELGVTLSYRAAVPFEVLLAIGPQEIEWRISRDLLRSGTSGPAGDGDVRLWPGQEGGRRVLMQLSSDSGRALLELPRSEILEFLGVTELLVPSGTEAAVFSIDDELQALLDGDLS